MSRALYHVLLTRGWQLYCETGEDKPSWDEWLKEREKVFERTFKLTPIAEGLKLAYER